MLFCCFLFWSGLDFQPQLILDIPQNNAPDLQSITSITVHAKTSSTYALDTTAKKVWVWDADGNFVRIFGRGGNGPGEFQLTDYRQGMIEILNDRFMMLDGQAKKLHYFTLEGHYLKTVTFPKTTGNIRYFQATQTGHILLNQYRAYGGEPRLLARVFGEDLTLQHAFEPVPFKAWIPKGKDANGRWDYIHNAFAPQLVLATDTSTKEIVLGRGDQNYFDVYSVTGERLRRVTFAMKAKPVSKEAATAYREEQRRYGNASVVNIPDHYPIYKGVHMLGDLGYLVLVGFLEDEDSGILIDKKGKTLAHFTQKKEGGWMAGIHGRLFAVTYTEEGDIQPLYYKVVITKETK